MIERRLAFVPAATIRAGESPATTHCEMLQDR